MTNNYIHFFFRKSDYPTRLLGCFNHSIVGLKFFGLYFYFHNMKPLESERFKLRKVRRFFGWACMKVDRNFYIGQLPIYNDKKDYD